MHRRTAPSRNTRIAPLDGLRAVAVLGVILFHAYTPWAVGGFYGVDVFFVLSGYLITSLLVAEWDRSGTISLRAFWARRARRLLPALFLMLLVVGAVVAAWPAAFGSPGFRGDTIATVFYASNWRFIAEHANYFTAAANSSPLLHTWTLAIEEQFYLIWPLAVLGVMVALGRRWRGRAPAAARERTLRMLRTIAGAGAIGSAIWMWILTPFGTLNVNRSYYGSDTRAQALLIGATLAFACALRGEVTRRRARRALGVAGMVGIAGVVAIATSVSETSSLAFHGGFFLVAGSAALVIWCVTQLPGHPLARVLGVAPVRYVGRISYGMYLWYWPVLLVMTPSRVHLTGLALLGARLMVISGLASLSFHLLESPVQRGVLAGWRSWVLTPVTASLAIVVGVAASVSPGLTGGAFAASSTRLAVPTSAPAKNPVRVLLVGDSMAGTLGVGLSALSAQYGVQIINRGVPSCALSSDQQYHVETFSSPPPAPCVPGHPMALLDQLQAWVRQYDPDVVVYLARSETFDTQVNGRVEHLGEPSFDRWVAQRFQAGISVLGSEGAHVVLLTTPAYDSGTQPDGSSWPEDALRRVLVDNRLIEQAVRAQPAVASAIDLDQLVSPGNVYAATVHGVDMRCRDGIHLTAAGGESLASHLLPQLAALGHAHWLAAGTDRPPVAPAELMDVPSWYQFVPCSAA